MPIGAKAVLVAPNTSSMENTTRPRFAFYHVNIDYDTNQFMKQLHFVHWNSDLYSSARQAAISKDGLAVVGVFLEAVDDDEQCPKLDSLETICDSMANIKFKGSTQPIDKSMNILELIPESRSYWTYLGSLTTPPLWETVTWIIFEKPIKCRQDQVSLKIDVTSSPPVLMFYCIIFRSMHFDSSLIILTKKWRSSKTSVRQM